VIPERQAATEGGRSRTTERNVPLAGETFITAETQDGSYNTGSYNTLTFVDGGRYLHNTRAVPGSGQPPAQTRSDNLIRPIRYQDDHCHEAWPGKRRTSADARTHRRR
jgi:hypothetical protein